MSEGVEDLCCFICNSPQIQERERIPIFGQNAVLTSGLKLSEAVSQIVGREIDPIVTPSSIVCRKCYKTCEEYDEINKRLSNLKSKMSSQFRQRLPSINNDIVANEMLNIKQEPSIDMHLKVGSPTKPPMKSLVLSKMKMTPISNVMVKSLPANINKPISLKNCIFVSPNKTTLPGSSLIKRDKQVNSSQPMSVVTPKCKSTFICTPSTSNSVKNLPIVGSIGKNTHGNTDQLIIKPNFHSIFENSVKMTRSSPVKNVQNATLHFPSTELQGNETKLRSISRELVQSSQFSEQKSDKYVISEVEIMQGDNEDAFDDDGEDTILMDQSGAILRVVRKDQDKLLFPQVEQVSLVMPDEQDIESDSNENYELECQGSNDSTQIALLEDTADPVASSKEQGVTYIKMESGELYHLNSIQTSKTDTTINRIVELIENTHRCLLCRNSSREETNSEIVDDLISENVEDKEVTFVKPEDMMIHLKQVHHIRVYCCPTCGQFYKRRVDLGRHISEEHNSTESAIREEQMSSRKYIAGTDPTIATMESKKMAAKQIYTDKNKLYKCQHCPKKYVSRNLLDEHMNLHTGARPYTCEVCDKTFASKYTYKAHMHTHTERPRPFTCTQCSKSFLSFQNLNQHIKTHSGLKEYHCKICNKAYASQHNLDVHGIVHSGKKPFVCGVCKKGFARRAEIRDHLRTHTGERPFECDMCYARFAQRSNLLSHRRTTHMDDRRYACSSCDKRFKRKRLLDYHIKASHTGERPYKCEECFATFVYPEHYKKHLRIHTGQRPFVCEVCNRGFNSRDNRNAHRFVHSNKKPYECLVCEAGFMRKPLLYAHMNAQNHLTDMIVVNQANVPDDTSIAASKTTEPISSFETSSVQISTDFTAAEMPDIGEKIFMEEEPASEAANEDEIELKTINLVHTDVDAEHGLLTVTGTLTEDHSDEQDLATSAEVEDLLSQGSEIMTTDEEGNIVRLIQIQFTDGKNGWVALDS